jgi:fatty acid desaturase
VQDFRKLLTASDFKPFLRKSDGQAWLSVALNYALIALAFLLPALWLNPVSVMLSLVLLGNRQLGLGILMHDCVHNGLFRSARLNRWVGEFLCAAPILAQFEGYRRYHLRHHAKAGTDQDPDYPNYRLYPVAKTSFLRKCGRDLLGITGLKNAYILLLMHAGLLDYDMAYQSSQATYKPSVWQIATNLAKNLWQALLFHGVLLAVLLAFDSVWLYALWWLAYFTTFMLFSRIRNAAEHAAVPNLLDLDPRLHARTVYASWWERLTVAPNHVNYHLEHHWQPAIPPYRLKAFHFFLMDKGILRDTPIFTSYTQVIRNLVKLS